MNIEVNGVEKEAKFDIGFIRRMDDLHRMEIQSSGVSFGAGLLIANVQLAQYNPAILVDILQCAIKGSKQADIDKAVEKIANEDGDLEPLFKKVREEMGKSPMVKATLKRLNSQNQ